MSQVSDGKDLFTAFVSMPYGIPGDSRRYWNDFYNALCSTTELFGTRSYSVNFLRADETVSALELKEGVKRLIQQSDMMLAVITGLTQMCFGR